jgi:hypothetical protein
MIRNGFDLTCFEHANLGLRRIDAWRRPEFHIEISPLDVMVKR